MKKLLGILVLGLLWCNISFANKINLKCSTSVGENYPKQVLDLKNKTITNLTTKGVDNVIKVNGEVKMYFAGYLPNLPILWVDTLDIASLKWKRIAGKNTKNRTYKKLKKKLIKINKKIQNYQKKEMAGAELFQVSKSGSNEQELEKMQLILNTIKKADTIEEKNYQCVKY